jgi:ribosomal protein L31
MKIDNELVSVKCSCGNTFSVLARKGEKEWNIHACPNCHPAYVKNENTQKKGKVAQFASKYGDNWSKYTG